MNVNEILDIMDDMLEKAWSLPLSGGKCVIDVERMRDLIGDVRLNIPTEVKQAKMIVIDRNQIISDAKKEAESIIKTAETRAKKILAQDEIVKQAQEKSNEMITKAHTQARDIKKAANDFVDKTLLQVEETLTKSLGNVRESRHVLRNSKTFPAK